MFAHFTHQTDELHTHKDKYWVFLLLWVIFLFVKFDLYVSVRAFVLCNGMQADDNGSNMNGIFIT